MVQFSWSTPGTPATSTGVTAAFLNIARDQVNYLKGKAGAVQIEDAATFHNDANFGIALSSSNGQLTVDATDYLLYDRTLNQYKFYIGGALVATLDATGIAYGSLYMLLQPMGASRHIEYGTSATESVAVEAENDDAFTFTKAYTKLPTVTTGLMCEFTPTLLERPRVHIKVDTLLTTGVTLTKNNPGTVAALDLTSYYIAEGPD